MNAHTLKVLEFESIVEMLRERASCALGEELARQLQPSSDHLAISLSLQETSEACMIIEEEGSMPLGGIYDIRADVNRSTIDAILTPSELLNIASTLTSARSLKSFIQKRSERCPRLAEIAANIGQFPRLEESIKTSINDNGEIRDTASPELAAIRSKLKSTHARIMDKLNSIVHSAQHRAKIQEHVITQRDGRYCIPIKAEYRPQFPGIVHDSSASGATVFIEPESIVDKGNDLKELSLKEQHEIERILKNLTGMVKSSAYDISISLDSLALLDFAHAKGALSCDMRAVQPKLNREGWVKINGARHPLLTGEVVPVTIELGRRFQALLITGPNTGGKTVTLKTMGLLALMAQSGLRIPAEPDSELAIFSQIFADIGDEQSIQQSLSTFSSHMRNIVGITENLGRDSLVLLDEIGAGTDPAEGAALAKAILEHLIEKGARTIATTHYGELKDFAFVRDGIENASVEFDLATLQPTYRLMIGIPGSSNAFAIASRLGLSSKIIADAREMMTGQDAADEIIRKIEQTHRAATEREQIAERTSRDVDVLRARYEERIGELEAIRRDLRRKLTEEVDRRVREKLVEVDQLIAELRRAPEPPSKKIQTARKETREIVKEIEEEVEEVLPETYEEPDEPFVLKAGDHVRVTTHNVEGELLNDPDDGEVQVMVGSIKLTVPFSTLRPARKVEQKKKQMASSDSVQIASSKAVTVSPEIHLRAQRAEPAIFNLDKYLDDAILAGLQQVRIIHGKGTGALKKAVWEYLSNHNAVKSYRLGQPSEGGEGATIVELKE